MKRYTLYRVSKMLGCSRHTILNYITDLKVEDLVEPRSKTKGYLISETVIYELVYSNPKYISKIRSDEELYKRYERYEARKRIDELKAKKYAIEVEIYKLSKIANNTSYI